MSRGMNPTARAALRLREMHDEYPGSAGALPSPLKVSHAPQYSTPEMGCGIRSSISTRRLPGHRSLSRSGERELAVPNTTAPHRPPIHDSDLEIAGSSVPGRTQDNGLRTIRRRRTNLKKNDELVPLAVDRNAASFAFSIAPRRVRWWTEGGIRYARLG